MNQRREIAELQARLAKAERSNGADQATANRADRRQIEARVLVAALRTLLINKNVFTAAEFNAAVALVKDTITP